MSQSAVYPPAVNGNRWEAVRYQACPQGKRVIDVNHERREVRWTCKLCRKVHVLKVGTDP